DTRTDSWHDDALWALAQMAASEGDLIGSGKMIERIRKEYPGSPYADSKVADQASTQARLLVEAINHQRDARYDAALASYWQLIEYCQEIDQPVGEALFQQAKLFTLLDQVEAARKCFGQCVAQGPANPQYLPASLALGQLDQSTGRHRQASEHYQNIITESPQTLPAQEARFRLAKMHTSQQDSTLALKLLREILETEVTEANLLDRQRTRLTELRQHAREGLIHGHAKRKEWAAVRDHAAGQIASVAEGPLRLSAEFWLAESEYRLGNDAEAKEAFSKVDRRSHSSQAVWTAMAPLRLAQIAARQSNWQEVLSMLAGFRAEHPQFPLLHEADYLVGRALAGRGRMSEARSSYQAVLDNALADDTETAARSQWMIGETFFHQEKYDLARDAYQKVIAQYDFPEWRVRAALQAGKCSELLGEWNQAQRFYKTTLEQDSEIEASSELAARLRWTQQQMASRKQRIE
ncbi:MAG: tetratricopeptide repeat protein, partial [Lacipirellulaceae bacterium]